jgi:hypothetical protein
MSHKESYYQKKLETYLNGKHDRSEIGITDITNDELHAEIKDWYNWKSSLNQLLLYNAAKPRSKLQVYLFGTTTDRNKELAYQYIPKFNIEIYELKHMDNKLVIIQRDRIIHTFEEDIENNNNSLIILNNNITNNITINNTNIRMELHKCDRCGYETDRKGNLITHLQKKNICLPLLNNIERSILIEKLTSKEYKETAVQCEKCDKKFNNKSSMYRHLKICNGDIKETIKNMQEKINELEDKLKASSSITNNITNNNQQNNITINVNNFCSNEDISYIDSEFIKECLKDMNMVRLLEQVHFHPEHPENHTVRIKNINKNLLQYHQDAKWKIDTKDRVLEDMINCSGYRILKTFYNANQKEMQEEIKDEDGWINAENLMKDIRTWLDKIDEEDPKIFKELKSDLFLVILNNKALVCAR